MKKQFLMGLAVVAAASMLCGFDSAETLDSLSEKMAAAEADIRSMSMQMDVNMDAALDVSDGTNTTSMPITVSGSVMADYTLDPLVMKMDGSVDLSAMTDGQTIPLNMYMVVDENGTATTYMQDPNTGSWEAGSENTGINLKELMDSATGQSTSYSEMAEWGLNFELAPEPADVDGTECYLISCTIDSAALNTIMQKASEETGQDLTADEDVSLALNVLGGLVLNLEYYVDTSTYLPAKLHIDFDGSDLSAFNALLAQSMAGAMGDSSANATAEISLNDCSLDATVNYNIVDEIVIPDEVLAAPAADTVAVPAE